MLTDYKIIDLTHTLSEEIPTWSGSCGFCAEIKQDYDHNLRLQQLKMHAGIGTHIDAPSHRFAGKPSVDEIPLEQLVVPACVINVSDKTDPDYAISVTDIEQYEKTYGTIPERALVIGYNGWDQYWNNPIKYRNVDSNGQMHFPVFSKEAAQYLLKRNIAGIAIDTLSPDCLDQDFPVHKLILGAGKYIIENIANCSQLPPKGATVIALPLRAQGCTESPMRVIGLISK